MESKVVQSMRKVAMSEDTIVPLIVAFDAIGEDAHPLVGGKGYNLGRLAREGFPIPPGFCVTTEAFRVWLEGDQEFVALRAKLDALASDALAEVQELGASLRGLLVSREMPSSIQEAIVSAWKEAGEERAFAVRSSATAEDLPEASFAGQQDTYLNIVGEASLLDSVRRCWASLFTDRAIVYRMQNDIPHDDVALSVVVQRMVQPDSSGILFTADPLTGHRGVSTIDAGFGLGEALVSGLISADLYKVDKQKKAILEKVIGDKKLEIVSLPGGGTEQRTLSEERQRAQVLSDTQILELAALGGRVEAMQGSPQDVEWCFEGDALYLVQSRPITSLYPLPEPRATNGEARAYVCFNHFQVMLDPIPVMGREIWQRILPLGKDSLEDRDPSPWTYAAGDRLYIDLAPILRRSLPRRVLLGFLSRADALAVGALKQLVDRPGFDNGPKLRIRHLFGFASGMMKRVLQSLWFQRPEGRTALLTRVCDDIVEEHEKRWFREGLSHAERLAMVRRDLAYIMPRLFFEVPPRIAAGVIALGMLGKLFPKHKEELSALGRGLIGNVTTDMDLEVGDLADVARRHPEVSLMLREPDTTWERLQDEPEAAEFVEHMKRFLEKYGSRGPSEIDVSRERWSEQPDSLLRSIAGNLAHEEIGAHRAHHQELGARAEEVARSLVKEAGKGLWGWIRRPLVNRLVRVHRNLFALREHPKFVLVRLFGLFRKLLLRIGEELVDKQSLGQPEDIFFLKTTEAEEALVTPGASWLALVEERKAAHRRYQSMFPPRVMTEDGEIPVFRHSTENMPEGALVGSPASAGVVEGIARVILDPTKEILHKGEILVAPFTDPGWTPLFINAAGLVMEVGGQLTHGSVVAREYGIPAVVSVPDITKTIQTGQRIRVDGDQGFVQILSEEEEEA
jgi:pyruvate,water dikinase